MAKRKLPPRNKKGRFTKRKRNPKRNAPKRRRRKTTRKRRKAPKKRRRTAKGTTVIVRSNPGRKKKGLRRRRRNPAMPPWAKVVIAAAGVAAGVELVKQFVPIAALKTNAAQALIGPAAALGVGMFFSRKAKTKNMGYALIGAGVWSLASYGTRYALAKIGPQSNPYRRPRRMVRRETRGIPADQKPRLAAGYSSMPATVSAAHAYQM